LRQGDGLRVKRVGSWEAGMLGSWEDGRLEVWEAGRLESWEARKPGNRDAGTLEAS